MKSKTELEQIIKLDSKELLKMKQEIVKQVILERSKLASSGQKNTPKIRVMRKKIARIETIISQNVTKSMGENGEKDV